MLADSRCPLGFLARPELAQLAEKLRIILLAFAWIRSSNWLGWASLTTSHNHPQVNGEWRFSRRARTPPCSRNSSEDLLDLHRFLQAPQLSLQLLQFSLLLTYKLLQLRVQALDSRKGNPSLINGRNRSVVST